MLTYYSMRQKAGKLFPNRSSPEDVYDLGEVFNRDATWLLYRDSNNENLIIKELGPSLWFGVDYIKKEIEATTKAGELSIGPKVIYSTIGNVAKVVKSETRELPVGYIVMEYIDGRSLTKSDLEDEEIVNEINHLLALMHENDMRHDDLHNKNVMIGNLVGQESRVWIIDHSGAKPRPRDSPLTVENIEF